MVTHVRDSISAFPSLAEIRGGVERHPMDYSVGKHANSGKRIVSHTRTKYTQKACDRRYTSSLLCGRLGAKTACRALVLLYVRPGIEPLRGRFPSHGPYQPEDWPVKPRPVVFTDDGPGDACVAIGIAPVQLIFVVEQNRPFEGARRVGTPFENFLGPIHPHIVVHPSGIDHLPLRRIP